jgi:hypothetical protein
MPKPTERREEVSDVTDPRWNDDDQLLSALDNALRSARAVPRELVEAGKAAYAWHDIDAELAALTYDSALESRHAPAVTRAEPAPLRTLTFVSAQLTIELEVTDDALLGQVVPAQAGALEVRLANRQIITAAVDELGWFVIRPVPAASFRLHCRTASGASVQTDWISL